MLAHTNGQGNHEFSNEREILYKLFFDMKKDVTELKRMFLGDFAKSRYGDPESKSAQPVKRTKAPGIDAAGNTACVTISTTCVDTTGTIYMQHVEVEESLNIMEKERELIIKALKKHKGKRKDAALDLGISERTLYRKLKEYDIEE